MKKIIAILLAVLILSTFALTVFADNGTPEPTPAPTDVPSPTGATEPTQPTNPNDDNGNTSPSTGNDVVLYAVVLVAALFGVVLSVKKLAKNH